MLNVISNTGLPSAGLPLSSVAGGVSASVAGTSVDVAGGVSALVWLVVVPQVMWQAQ